MRRKRGDGKGCLLSVLGGQEGIDMENYQRTSREMLDFVEKSPTGFHVVKNLTEMLEKAGFQRFREEEDWRMGESDGFYVTRNDSSVIAIRLPARKDWKGFHIVASHSDSPAFKIKENPEMAVEKHYVKLNVEKYGGMILSTWLDRPLSVAGRLAVRDGQSVETRLVNVDEDLLVIPNVAVHLNREINKGMEYNPQVDMLPLFGDGVEETGTFLAKVAEAAGVNEEDILGHDLFLYVREKGKLLGANGPFVLSPRLDDQQCVFASMKAFLESVPQSYVNVCAVFDNEEVGSGSRQGADSDFLETTLRRLCEAQGLPAGEFHRLVAGGFLISADNAHAVHPNHPEISDPTNRPFLNGGLVIKYHGGQKYTTDALSAARMKSWCQRAEVPCQTYFNRSDIEGGSTLGHISTAHVSISSVDIGLPQLAMHSAVETAGIRDTEYAVGALCAFYKE